MTNATNQVLRMNEWWWMMMNDDDEIGKLKIKFEILKFKWWWWWMNIIE